MRGLETIAHRLGLQQVPALCLALLLSVAVGSVGCGSEGHAETTDDEATATQQTDDTDSSDTAEKEAEADESDKQDKKKKAKKGDDEEEKAKVAIPVSVADIEHGTVSAYLTATANLVAENEVKVLAEAEGRVDRLLVDEGQMVRQGQLLASLVADEAKIALAKAEVKHTNAKLAFERGQDLTAKELLSREDMDKLRMDFEIAGQELAEAQWKVQKTEIRSPLTGQVSERMIQLGKHVRNGDELFQITDFEPLIARIYFPETDIIGLEDGRSVRLKLNADSSVQFEGRIRHVSDVVDVATGTVKVTVEAPAAPAGVRPGSFVTVDIVRETRPDVLKLPKEAVIRELRSAHVFVAKDNIAEKREVVLGLEEGGFVEAVSGIASGDKVIVLGQGGLKHGSEIQVLTPTGEEIRES